MRTIAAVFPLILLVAFSCSESDPAPPPVTDGDAIEAEQSADGDGEFGDADLDSEPIPDGDGELDTETDAEAEAEAAPWLPADENGPYHIGAFATVFVDPPRERDLTGTVWYPSDTAEGEKIYYQDMIPLGEALKDIPITEDGPFPLILFSHGHQSFDAQSFFLTEFLTTHGYIVAACDHIEDTTGTQDDIYLAKSVVDRPQDVSLMIDTLLAWNADPGHRLYGKIDPERIGVTGHSFGGYTAIASLGAGFDVNEFMNKCEELGQENWTGGWRFCKKIGKADMSYVEDCTPCRFGDERIKVSVPMTPALYAVFAEGEVAAIDKPMLIMGGENDTTIPAASEVYPFFEMATHPDTIYWELAGAGHFTFSNMCQVLNLPEYGCGSAFTDPDIAYKRINTATLAYFNIFLRADERYWQYFEEPYLTSAPEVSLERKGE